jgi:cobaltochelatase CobT
MTLPTPLDRFRSVLAGATRAIARDSDADVVFASDASGQSPGKIARVVSPGPDWSRAW